MKMLVGCHKRRGLKVGTFGCMRKRKKRIEKGILFGTYRARMPATTWSFTLHRISFKPSVCGRTMALEKYPEMYVPVPVLL